LSHELVHTVQQGASPTVRRTPDEDIQAGDFALDTASSYGTDVHARITGYRKTMLALNEPGSGYEDHAAKMAAGYRAWSENYYNKTQAYLYEAQLATERTKSGQLGQGKSGNQIAYLGVDTDENPDIEFWTEHLEDRDGRIVSLGQQTSALEIKASTSKNYASIDGLLAGGVKQLKKREAAKPGIDLHLDFHLDNPAAAWPFTDTMLQQKFNGDVSSATKDDFDTRLAERIGAMKATNGIAAPLTVRGFYGGGRDPYCEATI